MIDATKYHLVVTETQKSKDNKEKNFFVNILQRFEQSYKKSQMLHMDFGFNISEFEEDKILIIKDLIFDKFGEERGRLMIWYVCNRIDQETGEEYKLIKEVINKDGTINEQSYKIKNPEYLWKFFKKFKLK